MKWQEYKREVKERGALALELYVALSKPAKEPERVKNVLPEHLAYIAKLETEGVLAFAGPMSDETGENMEGMGMIVLRAESMEQARALAAADPMHESGARSFVLRRWLINEGSVTLSVG
ncbi:MAG: YciI family protein, partial [Pseudomonadota bacterium]